MTPASSACCARKALTWWRTWTLGVEVSSLALQLAMARAGVGIAVVSALGASHRDAADLRFSPLRPAVQREVFVMQQRDRALSVPARGLMEAVLEGTKGARVHRLVRLGG